MTHATAPAQRRRTRTAHPARPKGRRRDSGAVTVEVAIGIVSLTFVVTLLSGLLVVLAAQLQLTQAAAEAARLLARGDDASDVAASMHRQCGSCSMSQRSDGDQVEATVTRHVNLPLDVVPDLTLFSRSTAALERATPVQDAP